MQDKESRNPEQLLVASGQWQVRATNSLATSHLQLATIPGSAGLAFHNVAVFLAEVAAEDADGFEPGCAEKELSVEVAFRNRSLEAVVFVAELAGQSADQGQADAAPAPFGMDDQVQKYEIQGLIGKVRVGTGIRGVYGIGRRLSFLFGNALHGVNNVTNDLIAHFRDLTHRMTGLKYRQKVLHRPTANSRLLLDAPDLQ